MAEEKKTVVEPIKEEEKKEKLADFNGRFVQAERYSLEKALLALEQYLSKINYLDEKFVSLVCKAGVAQTERLYYPIYRMQGKAEYLWVTGSGEHAVANKEVRSVTTSTSFLPEGLKVGGAEGETPFLPEQKLAYKETGKKLSVKDCAKLLRAEAEASKPKKQAKFTFLEENYEVSYLPVLKVVLPFEGKNYTAFVNLVSGDCISEYAVSKQLTEAVGKTLQVVKQHRAFIFLTFFYSLAFSLMAVLKLCRGAGELLIPAVVLSGLAFLELLLWLQGLAFKKSTLLAKAVKKGKLPKANATLWLSILSAIIAIAVIALFTLQIL